MNWIKRSKAGSPSVPGLVDSILYDEKTFYHDFSRDLIEAGEEVIIDSPFIALGRLKTLEPVFEKLTRKNIKVFIVTKPPSEHAEPLKGQAEAGIRYFEALGIQVLLCEGHHRKLAMIDRKVLWECSLNILSQSHSREYMRRVESRKMAGDLFKFLHYDRVTYFKQDY